MMIRIFLSVFLVLGSLWADTEKNSTHCFSVGELGREWEFPSDHLPIGVTVDGHHFVSWNILDTQYLQWIEKNTQGLKESAILRDNIPSKTFSKLTVREENIIFHILEMVHHPSHPRSILAFQETSNEMLDTLKEVLPESFVSESLSASHGDVFFFDQNKFEKVKLTGGCYKGSHNTWMSLTLRDRKKGQLYTIIQSHVPGGAGSLDARKELSEIVLVGLNPKSITLIMGDQNRSPDQFLKNLQECSEKKGWRGQPFKILEIPYPTHVNTLKEASWIDNLFIAGPTYQLNEVKVNDSCNQFFADLELPITIMWQKYALADLIQKTQNQLPQTHEVISLFHEILDKVRPFFLMQEEELEKFLKAMIFMSRQNEGLSSPVSASHSLKVCKLLWEIGGIRNLNTLMASLLQNGMEKPHFVEVEKECGERVSLIVQENPYFATRKNLLAFVDTLSLDARLILLADMIVHLQENDFEDISLLSDFLEKIKGTNEALENELSKKL